MLQRVDAERPAFQQIAGRHAAAVQPAAQDGTLGIKRPVKVAESRIRRTELLPALIEHGRDGTGELLGRRIYIQTPGDTGVKERSRHLAAVVCQELGQIFGIAAARSGFVWRSGDESLQRGQFLDRRRSILDVFLADERPVFQRIEPGLRRDQIIVELIVLQDADEALPQDGNDLVRLAAAEERTAFLQDLVQPGEIGHDLAGICIDVVRIRLQKAGTERFRYFQTAARAQGAVLQQKSQTDHVRVQFGTGMGLLQQSLTDVIRTVLRDRTADGRVSRILQTQDGFKKPPFRRVIRVETEPLGSRESQDPLEEIP